MVTEALLLAAVLGPPVDFFYFAAERRSEIEVPFALHGACKDGVSIFPELGVSLEEVLADGAPVERRELKAESIDEYVDVAVRPGPGFHYRMPVDGLESTAADPRGMVKFVLGKMPKNLAITYRIRCADGSSSARFVTRGRQLPAPPVRLFHQSYGK